MAKHYFEQLKGRWGLLLLGALGLFLLLYGGMGGGENEKGSDSYFADAERYRLSLEVRLEELCASVAGVSSPDVLVTLASGEVSEYAENGGRYVVSGGEGLLVSRRMPPVTGVAVVCSGEQREEIRREITMLIAAALDLGTNRIYVSFR